MDSGSIKPPIGDMDMRRIWAAITASVLIISGLSLLGTGTNNEPVVEQMSTQRVVLVEEFTHWDCVPCVPVNAAIAQAVETLGYDKVAPAFIHIAISDPVSSYNYIENYNRSEFYSVITKPQPIVDGQYETASEDPADWIALFESRALVPPGVSITTQGSIDALNKTGNVSAHIEVLEPIAGPDTFVHFLLWENNITRDFGGPYPPYPNGETEFKWATWDMLPTDFGEIIFPAGAGVVETVDIYRNFSIEDDWDIDELGVTVLVQSWISHDVMNAAVETFDSSPPPPTVDVQIPEPTGPWPDWRFMSYPIDASGDVASVLDDSVWGDGQTTWDNIVWYDPQDSDHWKSYSPYKPAGLNDLPPVDNTMGFWLHITGNGGDQVLSVGTGFEPTGTTVHLYHGWNLVGYPSQTETYTVQNLMDDSGVVTIVERYNPAAAYNIDVMSAGDSFQREEAYWIFATGDYDWIIS
jgi:hypothetical protein